LVVAAIVMLAAVACSPGHNDGLRRSRTYTNSFIRCIPASPASPVSGGTAQSTDPAGDEAAKTANLTSEELNAVVKQLGDINGVELKLTVDDSERQAAVKALEMDPLEGQLRQVTFFDTMDLALSRAGVVARLRRVQGKPASSTIKLRPLKPSQITPQLRAVPSLSIELDVMNDRYICSASLEREEVDDKLAKAVVAQKQPIRELFSEQQRAFYKEHMPQGPDLDSLSWGQSTCSC
jgi:antitoxin component of MazEF toxin-antitoxin module